MKTTRIIISAILFSQLLAVTAQAASVGLRDVISAVECRFSDPQGQSQTGKSNCPSQNSSNQTLSMYGEPFSDVTLEFFQRTYLKAEDRDLRGDGEISFKPQTESAPLKFRIEYFRPLPHEIVSNGSDMWISHPANRQVILSNVSFLFTPNRIAFERDRAVNFLHGLGRISKDFLITFAEGMYDKDGNYVLELSPRKSMMNIRKLYVVVSKHAIRCDQDYSQLNKRSSIPDKDPDLEKFRKRCLSFSYGQSYFPILSTTVYDQQGNFTTIEITSARINNNVPDSQFDYMIPPGSEVVKPSENTFPR